MDERILFNWIPKFALSLHKLDYKLDLRNRELIGFFFVILTMPVSPTSPTSEGVPRSNSFSNRMSKILHAAHNMSPTIRRKNHKTHDKDDTGRFDLWMS